MLYLPIIAMFILSMYTFVRYKMLLGSGKLHQIEAFMIWYKVTLTLGMIGLVVVFFFEMG